MTLQISFELNDDDLARFQTLFSEAREKMAQRDAAQILSATGELVEKSLQQAPPDFIRERLDGLSRLVTMAKDDTWRLLPEERRQIVDALAYFVMADDLIPDSVPVIGLMDDAIAAELVLRSLQHELESYEEFCEFRDAEAKRRKNKGLPTDVSKEDWLADRRATLHSRMRRRRLEAAEGWHTITLWGND